MTRSLHNRAEADARVQNGVQIQAALSLRLSRGDSCSPQGLLNWALIVATGSATINTRSNHHGSHLTLGRITYHVTLQP